METKEEKQLKLDKRYIRMASIWAENSYCERRQVGALIVKDKMIISDGYNGTPAGFENVCEDDNGVTKPYVLHAEANAITKIARSNNLSLIHIYKEQKAEIIQAFKEGEKKIIVATKAFGMGVDISDIDRVYHVAPSSTFVDYIQEIGDVYKRQLASRKTYFVISVEMAFPAG